MVCLLCWCYSCVLAGELVLDVNAGKVTQQRSTHYWPPCTTQNAGWYPMNFPGGNAQAQHTGLGPGGGHRMQGRVYSCISYTQAAHLRSWVHSPPPFPPRSLRHPPPPLQSWAHPPLPLHTSQHPPSPRASPYKGSPDTYVCGCWLCSCTQVNTHAGRNTPPPPVHLPTKAYLTHT
jgi:hypothetical protein